jgi:DNA-binding XRE family transcriptional regulator
MGSARNRNRPEKLGEKLRTVRERLGLTQPEMAAAVSDDKLTVYKQDIWRYERNVTDPPLLILLRYSRLAKIKMEVFADDCAELSAF